MQTKPQELLRQQTVLTRLGFYSGPLDGLWGPDSIDAMRKFENRVAQFRPARPTGGLPFAETGPLPNALWRNRDGLICCDGVEEVTEEEKQLVEKAIAASKEKPSRTKAKKNEVKPEISSDTVVAPAAEISEPGEGEGAAITAPPAPIRVAHDGQRNNAKPQNRPNQR